MKVNVAYIVTINTQIGNIVNTGNTSKPNLHIHAEKGGEPNTISKGTSFIYHK